MRRTGKSFAPSMPIAIWSHTRQKWLFGSRNRLEQWHQHWPRARVTWKMSRSEPHYLGLHQDYHWMSSGQVHLVKVPRLMSRPPGGCLAPQPMFSWNSSSKDHSLWFAAFNELPRNLTKWSTTDDATLQHPMCSVNSTLTVKMIGSMILIDPGYSWIWR